MEKPKINYSKIYYEKNKKEILQKRKDDYWRRKSHLAYIKSIEDRKKVKNFLDDFLI